MNRNNTFQFGYFAPHIYWVGLISVDWHTERNFSLCAKSRHELFCSVTVILECIGIIEVSKWQIINIWVSLWTGLRKIHRNIYTDSDLHSGIRWQYIFVDHRFERQEFTKFIQYFTTMSQCSWLVGLRC